MKKNLFLLLLIPLLLTSCSNFNDHTPTSSAPTSIDVSEIYRPGLYDNIKTDDGFDFSINKCNFDGNYLNVTFKGHFYVDNFSFFDVSIFLTRVSEKIRGYFRLTVESIEELESTCYEKNINGVEDPILTYYVNGEQNLKYEAYIDGEKIGDIDLDDVDKITYRYNIMSKLSNGQRWIFQHEDVFKYRP